MSGETTETVQNPPEATEEPTSLLPDSPVDDGIDPGPPLEASPEEGEEPEPPVQPASKPEYLNDKFWDAEKGQPKLEEMAKSYKELETKLRNDGKAPPEAYELELPEGVDALPDEDAEFFRDLGLNNDQAQKALNYIVESVVPELQKARASAELAELSAGWSMAKDSADFQERLKSIKAWGSENLPAEVIAHMSRTADGVSRLWTMMQSNTVVGLPGGRQGGKDPTVSTDDLAAMMADDRYWNEDPSYIAEVERKAGYRQ